MNRIHKIVTTAACLLMTAAPTLAADPQFTLKLHHPGAPEHPYTFGMDKFKDLVETGTNGTIQIKVYPNNQLASGAKAVESVQFGTINIALESTMTLGNFVRQVGVLNLPFLFKDRQAAYKTLDGDIGRELEADAEKGGFKILAWCENGFRNISNSAHPINSPSDVKGLKIRVPESRVFIATFKALGAIPTPMAFGELFTALQLHTVDGQENPNSHLVEYSLYEVQKYYALTRHIYTAEPLFVTTEQFDKFSENQKNVMLTSAKEACSYERELSAAKAQKYLDEIKAKGIEVTSPDIEPFREAVAPVYDEFRSEFGPMIDKILSAQK